jgi:ribonuclease T1
MRNQLLKIFFIVIFSFFIAINSAKTLENENFLSTIEYKSLPKEAQQTLLLIQQGGPFPFKRDGITFNNFEKQLPKKPRGYYQEFTVITPGLTHRGKRRIVTGGLFRQSSITLQSYPPQKRESWSVDNFYYTDNHYQSFYQVIHYPGGKR